MPAGGSCTTGAAGAGAIDATIPGQSDPFDFAVMAWVNNTQVGGNLSVAGNTATFSPVTIGGLTTQHQYYILTGSPTMRALRTLTNPTGSAVSVPVDDVVNYGSDGGTMIKGTSSGDTAVTIADRWICAISLRRSRFIWDDEEKVTLTQLDPFRLCLAPTEWIKHFLR